MDPSVVLSTKLGSTLLRKPIATVSLHRQRTSRRQRASHLHQLMNGDVYGSRILIATPTSLSHVRATSYVCHSVCQSGHTILAVRAIKSIMKDTILLSARFAAILKWRFS